MALEIIWTILAEKTFEDIINYLSVKWDSKTADNFINKTFNFLEILSVFPEIGKIERKRTKIRGFVLTKQTTIFYKINHSQIILISFHDNRKVSEILN